MVTREELVTAAKALPGPDPQHPNYHLALTASLRETQVLLKMIVAYLAPSGDVQWK